MKKKKILIIALCLVVAMTAISATACMNLFGNNKTDPTKYYIDIGNIEDTRVASIVYNNTHSSCVRIISEYRRNNSTVATSASSGFVITEDGYVLTNRHCVIRFNSTGSDTPMFESESPLKANYSVVFMDNMQYDASLVAYSNSADLAILKISSGGLLPSIVSPTFDALTFETNHDLYYGERLYTIGNPENIGLILTELMVASPATRLNKSDAYDTVLLDGNINHGNSGGALINAYSRVSGIIFARVEGNNKDTYGIGCAIPTSTILSFINSVKNAKINYKTTPVEVSSGTTAA